MIIKVSDKTAIVFDLDDTLYYELDYLISAYKEIALFLDRKQHKFVFYLMFSMYRNKLNVFDFLCKKYEVSKDVLFEMYLNHQPKIKLSDGVLDTFKKIKQKKGKIGIITDGRKVTQRNKIKSLGINNYVDFVSISEEIGFEKPHYFPFENMTNKLQCSKYYYIADNVRKDFVTPNKMNWETIGLIDGGKNIHNNFFAITKESYLPKQLVYSFNDIRIE